MNAHKTVAVQFVSGSTRALACSDRRPRRSKENVMPLLNNGMCQRFTVAGGGADHGNSGFKVYLVERDGAIGGMMAHLDKTFPTGDCATCIVSPKLVECARNL